MGLAVTIESVAEGEEQMQDEPEDLREVVARLYRERDERIAALPAKLAKEPLDPPPRLKKLVDSQDEFRKRVRSRVRAAMYGW